MIKYYKYNLIMLEKDDYETGKINFEYLKKKTRYVYFKRGLGVLRTHKRSSNFKEITGCIDFIAYKENGNLYDLMTRQLLTKSPGDGKEFESDKIYYSDEVELISSIDILRRLKQLPRKVLRDYHMFMDEDAKTTTQEIFFKKENEKEQMAELCEQIKKYQKFVKRWY